MNPGIISILLVTTLRHNEPIIRRCEKLSGYTVLIAKVREFEAEIAGDRNHSPTQ
jgi:hypothetical protein